MGNFFEKILPTMDYEEFYNIIWGSISLAAVPEKFRTENKEFIRELTYSIFFIFNRYGGRDTSMFRQIIETQCMLVMRFKPKG